MKMRRMRPSFASETNGVATTTDARRCRTRRRDADLALPMLASLEHKTIQSCRNGTSSRFSDSIADDPLSPVTSPCQSGVVGGTSKLGMVCMRSRYGALAVYSILLTCVAVGALLMALLDGVRFPPWWVVLLGIAACQFVWQFGLRAPRLGLISMERLPQIC